MKKIIIVFIIISFITMLLYWPYQQYREQRVNEAFISAEWAIRDAKNYYDKGLVDEALLNVRLAQERYPNYFYSYLLEADWLWELGDYQQAVIVYHQALAINYYQRLAYERIIEFYQMHDMYYAAQRYTDIYDNLGFSTVEDDLNEED